MAYNNLSGTVLLPSLLTSRLTLPTGSILSGNLSTSDGAEVINVPRVSNATNNSILTNVGGDANTLTCESNLKFDGTTLSVVGDVSASINISASAFYGDGSKLTNISFDNITAAGPAFSVQLHDGADGDITGSSNLTFQNNILRLDGGLKLSRRTLNATATASVTDYFVGIDTTNNPVDFRLPNAASLLSGQTFIIKDEGGVAHTNNITILASGSQTIDGQNSIVLESPFASVQLYCNGTNKYFIY
tara:strand:- start:7402 stop:8139 length:738 start_codon:yes stop_codon:yes gene_type:complete